MKRNANQKFLLAIVIFLVTFQASPRASAAGRGCSDLFQTDLLAPSEASTARLSLDVDRASYAAATLLTESALVRVADPQAFIRFAQSHIVKTFETNVTLMFNQRRDLFDFLTDPKNPLKLEQLAELLQTTSQISLVKTDSGEIFQVIAQDRNAFFEVANRLRQNRRALH